MSDQRVTYTSATEYLSAVVKPPKGSSREPLELDTQLVEISFDNQKTWLTAEWVGDPGTTRSCRVLAVVANLPKRRETPMHVRVHTVDEKLVAKAGTVFIE